MRALSLLLTALTLTLPFTSVAADRNPPLTVFAAASLTDALTEISDAYTKAGGAPVRLSFAASSALARQIEAGRDIFG